MRIELAGWIIGSMALFAIGARLYATRIGAALRASSIGRMTVEGARFVYYLGLPYAALWSGAFAPRDLGLQGSPSPALILGWPPEAWTRAAGHAVALAAPALLAAGLLIWQVRRAGGRPAWALGARHQPIAYSIRDAVYAEVHWSFYRALPIVALADTHWAALAGMALTGLEAILAGRLVSSETGRARLFEMLLAGLSATYFALTGGNVWMAILAQIAVRAGVAGMIGEEREADAPREAIV